MDRILLLAPHVREQQAPALERVGIEYIDLAGNVHLNAPGLFVHVEGRRPPKARVTAPVRPHKGWVKAVMALLVRPDLVNAPYRTLVDEADVALGTVAKCMNDLALRGLLLERDGERTLADRPALVALWVQAYAEVLRPRLAERRLQVRADDKPQIWARLQTVLGERGQGWALTGADAAAQRDHYFRAAETEVYAPVRIFDDREVQKALVAQPAARGGNLLVIEPPGPLAVPRGAVDVVPTTPNLLAYATGRPDWLATTPSASARSRRERERKLSGTRCHQGVRPRWLAATALGAFPVSVFDVSMLKLANIYAVNIHFDVE